MKRDILSHTPVHDHLPLAALQAYWQAQPRAVRLFTPELAVRWDSAPDRLAALPLYRDASGAAVPIPPEGRARNAWPVARALAEGGRVCRSYALPGETPDEEPCYRVLAYPIEVPGEGTLIVEETERIDRAMCHDERLRGLDAGLSGMLAGVADFLTGRAGSDLLRLRLANPNLQPCHQIKQCRRRRCPAHGAENLRCWEIEGTLCPDAGRQHDSLAKFEHCTRCDVYLMACPDPLTRIGENVNRLLSFLQLKYEEALEMHERVRQSEKLAALGELTMGIVHEIKNPLSVLSSRLDCLALELDPAAASDLEGDLAVLRAQIARMRRFLEDLLAFARPAEAPRQPLAINEVIRATLPLFGKTLEKAQIRLESRLTEELPPIEGDPVSIQQILLNLMLNAREATPPGGVIRISSRLNPKDAGQVQVAVRDSGRGIAPAELPRIFSPFFSRQGARGGAGLGLAICSRIMSQHGGAIAARSRPGQGAAFTLTFPVSARALA